MPISHQSMVVSGSDMGTWSDWYLRELDIFMESFCVHVSRNNLTPALYNGQLTADGLCFHDKANHRRVILALSRIQ
ncbi:uncharacterized protein RCO7_14406 [Rhynchosporium graminicola]|uniref:Uncharacterized protein n=1 Tax=Rhynchosporium graminicola TaxID=2792576 RepID=A0A1E1KDR3_9HELO|nr:uncharacterized protein RCO7_14406 [Rhynchosporium commune]